MVQYYYYFCKHDKSPFTIKFTLQYIIGDFYVNLQTVNENENENVNDNCNENYKL